MESKITQREDGTWQVEYRLSWRTDSWMVTGGFLEQEDARYERCKLMVQHGSTVQRRQARQGVERIERDRRQRAEREAQREQFKFNAQKG